MNNNVNMNRSAIQDPSNGKNNFQNSVMKEEKLKPSVTGELIDVSIPVTDIGMRSVDTNNKPKNLDGEYVNSDDVNLMKRTTIDGVNNFHTREGVKGSKPVTYAAKKTVAQGMMDIALLTSNANQLRNLMTYQRATITFYLVMPLIILSLVLQISVGIFLIFKGRFDTKGKDKFAAARVNKQIMAAVFLITIINIFIAVFSIPETIDTNQPAA